MKKNFILLAIFIVATISQLSARNIRTTVELRDGEDTKISKSKEETALAAPATTWEFYSASQPLTAAELAEADNHKFGQTAGCLYTAFMEHYVVKEEIVPGDPARRTVIKKPAIYNAVRSIEKQLGKALKNNELTPEQAAEEFTNILHVAMAAIDSESNSFEASLQDVKKDPNQLLAVFNRVKLKNIY